MEDHNLYISCYVSFIYRAQKDHRIVKWVCRRCHVLYQHQNTEQGRVFPPQGEFERLLWKSMPWRTDAALLLWTHSALSPICMRRAKAIKYIHSSTILWYTWLFPCSATLYIAPTTIQRQLLNFKLISLLFIRQFFRDKLLCRFSLIQNNATSQWIRCNIYVIQIILYWSPGYTAD